MVPALEMTEVCFAYAGGTPVLDAFALNVRAGEKVLLVGPSGSGKSTLLGLVCGTILPDAGRVEVLGEDMADLAPGRRDRFRARHLGVVFQQFNLVPYLGVVDNVMLPLRLTRTRVEDPGDRALRLLAALGLDPTLLERPVSQLSVGQQQRVAAARAFIMEPGIVLADEPTSALDPDRRDGFMALMTAEAKRTGAALVCVSHDPALRPHFDRVVSL